MSTLPSPVLLYIVVIRKVSGLPEHLKQATERINKSLRQSFDRIDVNLRKRVFTHGQFYVAMSKVTDVHNLCILSTPPDSTRSESIGLAKVLLEETISSSTTGQPLHLGGSRPGERPRVRVPADYLR